MKHRKKKNSIKKWIGRIHLWMGLTSGLIVFIVSITGCIFVFHDEIRDFTSDWRKVVPQDEAFIAPSVLRSKVLQGFPEAEASMVVYQNKERPAHVFSSIEGVAHHIYFNPYSGELLHVQNLEKDFFLIIEDLHMHLLLPEKIGKQVVGISTIIFVFMLITGIILWWPKKRKNVSDKFQIKWKARWRRVNYDWHQVTGVYISLLALVIAFTGLSFSYEWMHESFYYFGNLGKEYPSDFISPEIEEKSTKNGINAFDLAFAKTVEMLPDSGMYFVWDQGQNAPIVTGAYPEALGFHHQSNFYFHPETGELLQEHFYSDKSTGLKLQEMNYGLHTGQFFGITGKIIAFFVSLFVAGLPVSGFMIWWGRNYKKKKRKLQLKNL
ncbi:PepSY-associated TM helix domain-containing protein [Salinimicrobium sp. GXAS 041]|uniref:PepSY-associated TM helix domain-containing protein n=1 Tax=Salinimicrobium sp. GXAS 041 TaxID=3400806 RepID=UPI003C749CAD